jgi:hypothetical protein
LSLKSRVNQAEERISKLKGRSFKNNPVERKKEAKRTKGKPWDL